jgi:predicted Zn-dependent protease
MSVSRRTFVIAVVAASAMFLVEAVGKQYFREIRPAYRQKLEARIATAKTLDDVRRRGFYGDYCALARSYAHSARWSDAADMYTDAIKLNSFQASTVVGLADALAKSGYEGSAYRRFEQASAMSADPFTHLKALFGLWRYAKHAADEPADVFARRDALAPLKAVTIDVLPLGVQDAEMTEDLRVGLQAAYGIRFKLLEPAPNDLAGYDAARRQYFVDPMLADARARYDAEFHVPGVQSILVVSAHDITNEGMNFVFGGTSDVLGMGVISFARFGGAGVDRAQFFKRVYTQALSTTGFMLGIPRCSTPMCARSYPHNLAEFKKKSWRLCPQCLRALDETRSSLLREVPEEPWPTDDAIRWGNVKREYGVE